MITKKTTKKPAKKSVAKKAVSGVKKAAKKVARSSEPGKDIAKSHPATNQSETIKQVEVSCSACGNPMLISQKDVAYYLDCGMQHPKGTCPPSKIKSHGVNPTRGSGGDVTMTETIKNGADKPVVTTTIVSESGTKGPEVEFGGAGFLVMPNAGAHVESVQAAEQDNTEVLAELDKHQLSIPEVCAVAWDEVKGNDDPVFADCVSTHQEKLLTHAQAILKGSAPQDGDTIWARFEREVARLK